LSWRNAAHAGFDPFDATRPDGIYFPYQGLLGMFAGMLAVHRSVVRDKHRNVGVTEFQTGE
jgi:hypothetical protein